MATSKILLGPIPHARYDWVSGASYGKEAIVFHKGSSYIALSDNPSTEPSFTYDPATGSYNVSAGWGLLAVGAAIVQETGDSQDKVMSQKVVTDIKDALEASIAKKQAKLTAGRGINISGSVISSTLDTNPFVVVSSLPATGNSEKIYLVPAEKQEEGNLTDEWIWNNGQWERLGSAKVDLTPYAKDEEVKAALLLKVDKVTGKGLSSNDYTDADKLKLTGLENYDDTEVRRLIGEKADEADLATVAKTGKYADLVDKPTTLSGYGITDAYTKTKTDERLNAKQNELTLTVKDNGNIVIGNIQGQTKEFMPATPSGDPMHYAYVAAGAKWNGTGSDIVKTAPWADLADDDAAKTVVHKAGYWYLNGLGDITNEQMRFIYVKTYNMRLSGISINTADISLTSFLRRNKTCRTNFAFIDSQYINVISLYYKLCRTFQESFCEVVIVGDTDDGIMVGNDNFYSFFTPTIKHIEGVLRLGSNYKDHDSGLFSTGLETVRIVQLASNLKMDTCANITSKSILYMIEKEAATSAITITLHADAYARAMANADILAALEAHPNVSLASAQ